MRPPGSIGGKKTLSGKPVRGHTAGAADNDLALRGFLRNFAVEYCHTATPPRPGFRTTDAEKGGKRWHTTYGTGTKQNKHTTYNEPPRT